MKSSPLLSRKKGKVETELAISLNFFTEERLPLYTQSIVVHRFRKVVILINHE